MMHTCTKRCIRARDVRCTCRCKGHNHGGKEFHKIDEYTEEVEEE